MAFVANFVESNFDKARDEVHDEERGF